MSGASASIEKAAREIETFTSTEPGKSFYAKSGQTRAVVVLSTLLGSDLSGRVQRALGFVKEDAVDSKTSPTLRNESARATVWAGVWLASRPHVIEFSPNDPNLLLLDGQRYVLPLVLRQVYSVMPEPSQIALDQLGVLTERWPALLALATQTPAEQTRVVDQWMQLEPQLFFDASDVALQTRTGTQNRWAQVKRWLSVASKALKPEERDQYALEWALLLTSLKFKLPAVAKQQRTAPVSATTQSRLETATEPERLELAPGSGSAEFERFREDAAVRPPAEPVAPVGSSMLDDGVVHRSHKTRSQHTLPELSYEAAAPKRDRRQRLSVSSAGGKPLPTAGPPQPQHDPVSDTTLLAPTPLPIGGCLFDDDTSQQNVDVVEDLAPSEMESLLLARPMITDNTDTMRSNQVLAEFSRALDLPQASTDPRLVASLYLLVHYSCSDDDFARRFRDITPPLFARRYHDVIERYRKDAKKPGWRELDSVLEAVVPRQQRLPQGPMAPVNELWRAVEPAQTAAIKERMLSDSERLRHYVVFYATPDRQAYSEAYGSGRELNARLDSFRLRRPHSEARVRALLLALLPA